MRKRKQIKKQKIILAFIMLLILLISGVGVGSVFSAETAVPTTLYVGTTQVVSGGNVTGTSSGDGWRYESATNTLYLDGANITGYRINGTIGAMGIYADGDLNINFSNTNTVKSPGASGGVRAAALNITGTLTLSGTGTLNVTTENAQDSLQGSSNYGIMAGGSLKITGGTISVKSGDTQVYNSKSAGIYAVADSSISGNAVVDVISGNVTGGYVNSYGIEIKGNLYVEDNAKVNVITGTSDYSTAGIYANVIASGTSKITATASEIIVSGSVYSYAIRGTVTISDSAVVIGESKATNPDYFKFGIYGDVIAEDGYYWRTSTSGDYTKSGTQGYNKTSSAYAELKGHTHEFDGSSFGYDADKHWENCTAECPIEGTSEKVEHSYTNGECECGYSIPFTITEHPQDETIKYAYTTQPELSIKIDVFDDTQTISYQWYENEESITGANSSTYKIPTGKNLGSNTYYCIVSTSNYSETSSEATVTIEQRDISNGTIEVIGKYSYTGNEITPQYNVTVDGISLNKDSDYTIAYTKDGNAATLVNAGTYTVTVTGVNGYKGTLTGSLEIEKAKPDLGQISYSGTVTD